MTRKRRRVLLLGAALLLAAGNLWWFARGSSQPEPDFVLGATFENARIAAQDLPSLPRYDAAKGTWQARGRPVTAIKDHIRPYRASDSVTKWSPTSYVAIGVEASAGPSQLHPIFLDLVRAGICDVAVVQDGMSPDPRGEVAVLIQHVVSVRDGTGRAVKCPAPQSAAAPSSASR